MYVCELLNIRDRILSICAELYPCFLLDGKYASVLLQFVFGAYVIVLIMVMCSEFFFLSCHYTLFIHWKTLHGILLNLQIPEAA